MKLETCTVIRSDREHPERAQDCGNVLDPSQRMKWSDPRKWEGGAPLKKAADNFGKAMCFFERKEGAIVGVGKTRWVTISPDGGRTWARPVRPEWLVSGMGKVWGPKTSGGHYALISMKGGSHVDVRQS